MKPKETIRKELYEYLEEITPLTKEQKKVIKHSFLEHDLSGSKNDIASAKKLGDLKATINKFLDKAKKLNSPKANLQAEGLAMCLNWLNQDDE